MPEISDPNSNGTPAVSPEPDVSASPADSYSNVVDHYRSQGYEIPDGVSGEHILKQLTERASAGPDPELVQHAAWGRQYRDLQSSPQWKAYQEWQAQQQKQQSPPKPEEKGLEWKVPKFNETWKRHVRVDPDSGRYIPADHYASPAAVEEANAYQEASQEHLRRLIHEFPELVNKVQENHWKKFKEQEFGELLEQHLARRDTSQRADKYLQDNEQEIYVYDQRGQQVIDPATGEPLLNSHGKLMQFYVQEAWEELLSVPGQKLDGDPTPEQLQWVQRYALKHTPRDVSAAQQWNEHIAQILAQQNKQGAAPATPPAAPSPPAPPAPSPAERNAATKKRSIADAKNRFRDNPGDVTPSRKIAAAASSPGAIPSLKERIAAKHGL